MKFRLMPAGIAIAFLLLALAALFAYRPGLSGPFLFDDFDAIHPLAQAQAQGQSWTEILAEAPQHVRARVLSNFTFLIDNARSSDDAPSARIYKTSNLAVHLACGLVLLLLARRLARRWGAPDERAWRVAWLACAVFVLHPLLVSTVLYPVQRMAQLATVFSLLSAGCYLRWREAIAADAGKGVTHAWLGAVLLSMLLSFASKQSGALTPLLILVVELCCFTWPRKGTSERTSFETGFGLVCAGPLVLGAVTLVLRWKEFAQGYALRDFTLLERLLTEIHVVAGYASSIVVPRLSRMGMYHDDSPIVRSADPSTVLLALGFALAIVMAVWLRKRQPAAAFAVLWFLAAHVLESTVIPLELVFEHRNYLALAGPALAFGWYLGARGRWLPTLAGGLAVLVLGVLTWQRASDWRDYATWIRAEAAHHPQSIRAGTDLFVHYLRHGDVAAAVAQREAMSAVHPRHAQPVLLKAGFACTRPMAVALFTPEDLSLLRKGEIGKDAFHAYVGLRDHVADSAACETDWIALSAASGAIAANPAVARQPGAPAAWLRLSAEADAQLERWTQVEATVRRVLDKDPTDPRDWLSMMEAQVELGDLAGYRHSRARLQQLVARTQATAIAERVAQLDRAASALAAPATP